MNYSLQEALRYTTDRQTEAYHKKFDSFDTEGTVDFPSQKKVLGLWADHLRGLGLDPHADLVQGAFSSEDNLGMVKTPYSPKWHGQLEPGEFGVHLTPSEADVHQPLFKDKQHSVTLYQRSLTDPNSVFAVSSSVSLPEALDYAESFNRLSVPVKAESRYRLPPSES